MSERAPGQRGTSRLTGAIVLPSRWQFPFGWAGAAALSALAVLVLFWICVPLNMDEFVSYQTLTALHYPNSGENVFCSSNASFYLRVLDRFTLPLLTYDYIGSLSSFLYSPFFLVWPSPMSARLTGVLALFVQAWVIGKMFRLRAPAVFCCLLLFVPYSFVHIADTGPVAFQTTSVFIVCYLLHRWILSRDAWKRTGMLAAAGLMVGLGCWVKPTYFFVSAGLAITGIASFVIGLVHGRGERLRRTAEYVILVICAATPTLLVYEAKHLDGGPYLPVLAHDFVSAQVFLAGLGDRFRENVFHFVIHPLDATAPYFDERPAIPAWTVMTCILGPVLILGAVFTRGVSRRLSWEMRLNAALFGLALLMVATNTYAKSMHHAVLAYPFIVLAVARGIQLQRHRRFLRVVLMLFIVLNGSLFLRFPSMLAASRRMGSAKAFVAELNDQLNRGPAAGSVIACVDWGIYFVKALYGPQSQVVLFLCSPDDDQQLRRSAAIAQRLHRDLVVVGLDGNRRTRDRVLAANPAMREVAGEGEGSPWRIWPVPYARLAALESAPAGPGEKLAP